MLQCSCVCESLRSLLGQSMWEHAYVILDEWLWFLFLCCYRTTVCFCRGDRGTRGKTSLSQEDEVSRQRTGYPSSLALLMLPLRTHFLHLFPAAVPGRGQQGSKTLLPLSLSFHHLPPPPVLTTELSIIPALDTSINSLWLSPLSFSTSLTLP